MIQRFYRFLKKLLTKYIQVKYINIKDSVFDTIGKLLAVLLLTIRTERLGLLQLTSLQVWYVKIEIEK